MAVLTPTARPAPCTQRSHCCSYTDDTSLSGVSADGVTPSHFPVRRWALDPHGKSFAHFRITMTGMTSGVDGGYVGAVQGRLQHTSSQNGHWALAETRSPDAALTARTFTLGPGARRPTCASSRLSFLFLFLSLFFG